MSPSWSSWARCSAPRCRDTAVVESGHGPRCASHHCADLGRPLDTEERAA